MNYVELLLLGKQGLLVPAPGELFLGHRVDEITKNERASGKVNVDHCLVPVHDNPFVGVHYTRGNICVFDRKFPPGFFAKFIVPVILQRTKAREGFSSC